MNPEVVVDGLVRRFGDRTALAGVSFAVTGGELVGVIGPNGSGKSTLFGILATTLGPDAGRAEVGGVDVVADPAAVRARIGVVFQRQTVDRYLTVEENLVGLGRLYGLGGAKLREAVREGVAAAGLTDRAHDRVGALSGGLARRAELARALMHRPAVLLLDEPAGALDAAARQEFWARLDAARRERGLTVLVTTHALDEAERCDRLALLDAGRLAALGSPRELKSRVGAAIVRIVTRTPAETALLIRARLGVEVRTVGGTVRFAHPRGASLVADLAEALGDEAQSITVSHPGLDEVFAALTGRTLGETA